MMSEFQPDDTEECQQPGDIYDLLSIFKSAVETASHSQASRGARRTANEAEAMVIAEIDRLETEAFAEGRNDQSAEFAALLPGPRYMDPPDGGGVTVHEQLRRMAEDAARYRWLCDRPDWTFIETICRQFPAQSAWEFCSRLSAEIDRMRGSELRKTASGCSHTARSDGAKE